MRLCELSHWSSAHCRPVNILLYSRRVQDHEVLHEFPATVEVRLWRNPSCTLVQNYRSYSERSTTMRQSKRKPTPRTDRPWSWSIALNDYRGRPNSETIHVTSADRSVPVNFTVCCTRRAGSRARRVHQARRPFPFPPSTTARE